MTPAGDQRPLPLNSSVDKTQIQFLRDRFRDVPGFISYLVDSSEGDSLYRELIAGLLLRAFDMHRHLVRAWEEQDLSYLAWANRNFWELKCWADYIAQSRENGKRFRADLEVDLREIADASHKLAKLDQAAPEILTGLAQSIDHWQAELIQQGWSGKEKFLPVGKSDDVFGGANKIASKYVHATALSILYRERQTGFYVDRLYQAAIGVCMHFLDLIANLLEQYSLPRLPAYIQARHY